MERKTIPLSEILGSKVGRIPDYPLIRTDELSKNVFLIEDYETGESKKYRCRFARILVNLNGEKRLWLCFSSVVMDQLEKVKEYIEKGVAIEARLERRGRWYRLV